jgi:serine O-acetyltransferase
MIKSYDDYQTYLQADTIALNRTNQNMMRLLIDPIWKYQQSIRLLEYFNNCNKKRLIWLITKIRYRRLGERLGFSIPINVFGPGLSIAHPGTIVVSVNARIGPNCRIHVCVNIGTQAGRNGESPQIGKNCYIGPGAKLFGSIIIGDNVAIGANAVVNKSFPEGNMTLGGIPARKISDKTSDGLLIKGYKC